MKDYEPKHRLPKNRSFILRWLTIVICLGITVTAFHEFRIWQTSADQIVVGNQRVLPQKLKNKQPFSILVMGTDVGSLGRGTSYAGNTDTMELITVNPKQGKILMVAIPRDTLVKINANQGTKYAKINATYAIGGAKLAKHQVSELLGVPVDYYALLNMGTLKKVVNAVGGIEVDNSFAFTYEGHHFKKGKQHLNGNEALKYSRMRYDDPNNDYGRQKRGQQIISSAINSFKRHGSVSAANKIILATKDGVRTDMPINNIVPLYLNYHTAMNKTNRTHLQGKDAIIEGTSFQIATPKELNKTSATIRSSLNLNSVTVNNNETTMYHQQTNWDGFHNLNFRLPNNARYNHFE